MTKLPSLHLAVLLFGAASLTSATGADLTWRGSTANWYTANAWLNGAVNASFTPGDNVSFTDAGLAQPTLSTLSSPTTVGIFAASNTTGTYTIPTSGANTLTGTTLTKSNAGTLTFNQTGAVAFSNTTLQGGTLLIRQTAFNGGAITVSGDTALGAASTASATTTLNGTSLLGSAVLTVSPQSATLPFALSSTLDTSAFTGTISASADGQLNIGSSSANLAQGKVVLSGNTRFQSSSSGIVSLGQITTSGSGNILGRSVGTGVTTTFEIGALNTASVIAGSIQNDGLTTGQLVATGIVALNKVGIGTLTLTGGNTYTGATSVSAGTLIVGNGTSGSLGNTATTVNAGAFYGNLSSGNVTTGAVTIGNSTGSADSTFGAGQAVIGRFASSSTLTLNSDAAFAFDLNSSTKTTDVVTLGGAITLNGIFSLVDLNTGAATWNVGDSFTVLSGLSRTGTFSNLAINGATISANGVDYQANYSTTGLSLTVAAIPEPTTWALLALGLVAFGVKGRRALRI